VASTDAALAKNVVLALVTAEPQHGWALQRDLAKTGEIGRIWSLSRQLTYKAIESLVDEGLVKRSAPEDGKGADKVILSPTAKGQRVAKGWLNEPVSHLRDVRTELLVKLTIRDRMGMDNKPFVKAQQEVFAPLIEAIRKNRGTSAESKWRRENARAIARFLEQLLS
jgi:PadR family transcriptional regulator AphA